MGQLCARHGGGLLIRPLARSASTSRRNWERKLDRPGLALSFDRLFASDVTGRARAFASMVNGGMDIERAAGLSGLLAGE